MVSIILVILIPLVMVLAFCMCVIVLKSLAGKVFALLSISVIIFLNLLFFGDVINTVFDCQNVSFKNPPSWATCSNVPASFAVNYQFASIIGALCAFPWTVAVIVYLGVVSIRSRKGIVG